jgi:hypothetical protein
MPSVLSMLATLLALLGAFLYILLLVLSVHGYNVYTWISLKVKMVKFSLSLHGDMKEEHKYSATHYQSR